MSTSAASNTNEQFAALAPVEIQGVQIGGKQLTDEQFAVLAFAATQDVDIGGAYEIEADAQKLPDAQRSYQRCVCDRVHYGMDFCQKDGGRRNAGCVFPTIVKDAREKTKTALTRYQGGDKAVLGKLVADGIRTVLDTTVLHDGDSAAISMENLGDAVMVSKLLPLLGQDAELKRAAFDAGLTEQDVDHARGIARLHQTLAAGDTAMQKLRDATAGRTKLGSTERKDCVDAVLRGKILTKLAREHTRKKQSGEAYQIQAGELEARFAQNGQDSNAGLKYQQDMNMLLFETVGLPEYLTELGKQGALYAQQLAEKEISRSALLKLDNSELVRALDLREKDFFQKAEYQAPKEIKITGESAARTKKT